MRNPMYLALFVLLTVAKHTPSPATTPSVSFELRMCSDGHIVWPARADGVCYAVDKGPHGVNTMDANPIPPQ